MVKKCEHCGHDVVLIGEVYYHSGTFGDASVLCRVVGCKCFKAGAVE